MPSPPSVIVVSGQLCAGKSTVARALADEIGASVLSVRRYISALAGSGTVDRLALQALGMELETQTGGRWLAQATAAISDQGERVVVDAVRTRVQLQALQDRFADDMLHLHLCTAEAVRSRRFTVRGDEQDLGLTFAVASRPALEHSDEEYLRSAAHIVIDTTDLTADEAAAAASGGLEARSGE